MLVFEKKNALTNCISSFKDENMQIGFVPTMGALHNGHISLVKKSQEDNHKTVVSIFVNPTQFNNAEDLEKYPKTIAKDLELLKKNGCDIVFIPTVDEMYSDNVSSKTYQFQGIEKQMEGKFREGHFDGVATIVEALFLAVNPNKSYFGEKDFQQLQIIKKLAEIENLPVEVIGCPILRENDGLAMSSRNIRLTDEERKIAPLIFNTLKEVASLSKTKSLQEVYQFAQDEFNSEPLFDLEYFIIANENSLEEVSAINFQEKQRAFIAVNVGKVRLIDNLSLSEF
jgi:pantoate--beta-alanine ligase